MIQTFAVVGVSPTPPTLQQCIGKVEHWLAQSSAAANPALASIPWCCDQEPQLREFLASANYPETQESTSTTTGIKFHNKSSRDVAVIRDGHVMTLLPHRESGVANALHPSWQIKTTAMGDVALSYSVVTSGSHHVFIVDNEKNPDVAVSPIRAIASPATDAVDGLLFAPGSSGYWRVEANFPFHSAMWRRTEVFMKVAEAYNQTVEPRERQTALQTALRQHNFTAAIGHSEGAARLLQCAAAGQLRGIQTLVLVSPAFSTHDFGTVDISSSIEHLRDVAVLLIDTDHGYAGSDTRYQWKERRELCRALHDGRLGGSSSHVFLEGSNHFLQSTECADQAVEKVLCALKHG